MMKLVISVEQQHDGRFDVRADTDDEIIGNVDEVMFTLKLSEDIESVLRAKRDRTRTSPYPTLPYGR